MVVDGQTANGHDADANMDGAGPSVPKWPRMYSHKPVVLDDFKTEAKQELEASVGLTGTAEAGSQSELASISFDVRRLILIHPSIGCTYNHVRSSLPISD